MSELIIHAAHRRPLSLRLLDVVFTLALWAGYLYLLRNVFFVVFTYFDLPYLRGWRVGESEVTAVVRSLKSYAAVIGVNAAVFVSWALYNQLMYGHRRRRRTSDPVGAGEVGAFFGLTEAQVTACHDARRLCIAHDRAGAVSSCDAFDKV
jgi:poly-beta-1,6-N-acetyl-D-glucosamine biosynthesis protein PgaD